MACCIINGALVETAKASVSVEDRGFRYGDGAFETIAVLHGIPYQLEWHLMRLQDGLNAIKIPFDTATLPSYCRRLLECNQTGDGFLRIQVTRGSGSLGYLPKSSQPTLVIETLPPATLPDAPVTLWKSTWHKPSPGALPLQYKLCQGLNSTLARMEAAEHHCFDALLFNDQGHVCETSSGNIFWSKGKSIYTPSLACGVLNGSTRAAILRQAAHVQEIEASLEDFLQADEVCICNVAWKALPVSGLLPETTSWRSDALAARFTSLLEADRRRYCDTFKWPQ